MDSNKLITAGALEYFEGQQDIENALRFLARIVYPSLPISNNYAGRLGFQSSDEKLYIYSSEGWKRLAFASEIGSGGGGGVSGGDFFEIDSVGAIMPAENPTASDQFELDENGAIMPKEAN